MKIVYMGTPAFACRPLLALHESRHEIQAVVTGPDERRGRRGAPCPTDVCCAADDLGLPIHTPKSLKSDKLYGTLRDYAPDLIVVVAFRILPERLFTLPRYGAINIHASLLPRYRGAAPINWALINGEKETGLTSFFLNKQVDTGNIILQEKTSIADNDNFDSLYSRLSELSGPFLLKTLDLIEQEGFVPTRQDDAKATPAPKITPYDAMIDFGLPADNVRNFVRGLSSKPAAFTWFRERKLKILACRVVPEADSADGVRPGTILSDRRRFLIQCADVPVEVIRLIPEGKKEMDGSAFVAGSRPREGELVGEATQQILE